MSRSAEGLKLDIPVLQLCPCFSFPTTGAGPGDREEGRGVVSTCHGGRKPPLWCPFWPRDARLLCEVQMGYRTAVWGRLERTSGPSLWPRRDAAANEGAKCGLLWDMRKQSLLQNSGWGRRPQGLTLSRRCPLFWRESRGAAHRTIYLRSLSVLLNAFCANFRKKASIQICIHFLSPWRP